MLYGVPYSILLLIVHFYDNRPVAQIPGVILLGHGLTIPLFLLPVALIAGGATLMVWLFFPCTYRTLLAAIQVLILVVYGGYAYPLVRFAYTEWDIEGMVTFALTLPGLCVISMMNAYYWSKVAPIRRAKTEKPKRD